MQHDPYLTDDQYRNHFMLAKIRLATLHIKFLAYKAGYDPNQPRVPAGFRDGGQWTDADGPLGNNLLKLEDDEGRTDRRGLNESHTIERHVGKTRSQLKARVRAQQSLLRLGSRVPRIGGIIRFISRNRRFMVGSFPSTAAANKIVRVALSRDPVLVEMVSRGAELGSVPITARFKSKTGIEAFAKGLREPRIRDTFGVRVVIRHDPDVPRGYRVITAFPVK